MKEVIREDIFKILNNQVKKEEIFVENPKNRSMGDFAVPCFSLSKLLKKNPNDIASYIKNNLKTPYYEKIEAVAGYLNIFINKSEWAKATLNEIMKFKNDYGQNNDGQNKTIVIDYSSPNIAKPFGVGHLRSTVIGNALRNICLKNGYKVIGINHLGDWGTQFGKLISAYKRWGNEEELKSHPLTELKRIYIKFHEEAMKNPQLEDEGRYYFKELEAGNKEMVSLWERFRMESLIEFEKTYSLLGVSPFDVISGESFYNDKMDPVVEELKKQQLLEESDGAYVVRLEDDMPPALIKRSDGATLYFTRDLAAAFYRKKTYHFDEALYVIGNEQTLHMKQLKKVITKMGYQWADDMKHISFGMILQDGKKMSTRHGKSVELYDVLMESIELSAKYISDRKEPLLNKREVSQMIGVGAVIFNDLKNDRTNDIEFNLEDILRFEGETGPYLQYTYARIQSLLKNQHTKNYHFEDIIWKDYIWNIIFKLSTFNEAVKKAKEKYEPSEIAKYIIDLAQDFNKFYAHEKIIDTNESMTAFRLVIAESVGIVLKEGLRLLGIEAPEKM